MTRPLPQMSGITLLAIAAVSACLPAARAAESDGGPRIACAASTHDFGSRDNQEQIEHTFTVRNEGDAPLRIMRVVGGCCGATAVLSASEIASGGEAALKVAFSLRGRKGRQTKTFHLASNDPTQPVFRLAVVGEATVPVDVEPQGLDFGSLPPNAAVMKTVAIQCQPGFDFAITNATSTAPWFRADFTNAGRHAHLVRVRTVPPLSADVSRCSVLLLTDSTRERFRRIEIPIVVATDTDLAVVPAEILLMVEKVPTPVTRRLVIRSRSGRAFRILGVEVPQNGTETVVTSLDSGGYRCELVDLIPAEDLDGQRIVVTTDSKEAPRIEIPIRVLR
jgi:hypothetical protein